MKKGYQRLKTYKAKTISLNYGKMTYVDQGKGEAILVAHGIFWGYDQAFVVGKERLSNYRIIAPSRFGYLGSERHDGAVIDASITNPDMMRNFNEYPIENLQMKTLIFHSKDDKLASYEAMEKALSEVIK